MENLLEAKKPSNQAYDQVEEMLEILISMSTCDKIRDILKDYPHTLKFVQVTSSIVLKKYKEEVPMVSNWLKFVGNMCYQTSKIKNYLVTELEKYVTELYPIYALD